MEIKEIKEDLIQFENLVKMINFEYTQFFSGNIKHPPLVHEREVNKIMRRYNLHQITNSTLRFKFNNLVARYLTFKEKWRRKMMEFEGVKKPTTKTTTASAASQTPQQSSDGVFYQSELDKLPAQYNKDKIQTVIESKIDELKKKGYSKIDVKIDIEAGKPKLRIKPRR